MFIKNKDEIFEFKSVIFTEGAFTSNKHTRLADSLGEFHYIDIGSLKQDLGKVAFDIDEELVNNLVIDIIQNALIDKEKVIDIYCRLFYKLEKLNESEE